MAFEVMGTVHKIFDELQVTERFRKRDFVLLIDDNGYPQHIRFQVVQDRCQLLDTIREGQTVTVHFDLSGKEYIKPGEEPRYYTDLRAWKIDAGEERPAPAPARQTAAASSSTPPPPPIDDDDLPF